VACLPALGKDEVQERDLQRSQGAPSGRHRTRHRPRGDRGGDQWPAAQLEARVPQCLDTNAEGLEIHRVAVDAAARHVAIGVLVLAHPQARFCLAPVRPVERRRLRRARRRRCGRAHLQGSRRAGPNAVDVDARLRPARGPHADARLRGDTRGRDGNVREKLAEGVGMMGGRGSRERTEPAKRPGAGCGRRGDADAR